MWWIICKPSEESKNSVANWFVSISLSNPCLTAGPSINFGWNLKHLFYEYKWGQINLKTKLSPIHACGWGQNRKWPIQPTNWLYFNFSDKTQSRDACKRLCSLLRSSLLCLDDNLIPATNERLPLIGWNYRVGHRLVALARQKWQIKSKIKPLRLSWDFPNWLYFEKLQQFGGWNC